MTPILITYIIGVAVLLFVGGIWAWSDAIYGGDLRPPVRIMLMSPIWPLIAPFALYRVIVWAFNINDNRFRKMFMG